MGCGTVGPRATGDQDVTTIQLSVVMPAHNEDQYLTGAVERICTALHERDLSFEILVCENGSVDTTAALAQRLSEQHPEVQVLRLDLPDYGRALRAGFLAAQGDLVVNVDVDAVDVSFFDKALARMDGPDKPAIVIGSKRAVGAADERAIDRRLVSAVFSTVLRAGFGLQVSDTHGLKMLRRDALLPLVELCEMGRDIFDTELVVRAERAGLIVTELPITVVEQRPPRSPISKRIPRTLLGLAQLRLLLWRTAPRRPRPN
jgi:glycosyltransferase involved in cell wall biosynthesis